MAIDRNKLKQALLTALHEEAERTFGGGWVSDDDVGLGLDIYIDNFDGFLDRVIELMGTKHEGQ